MLGSMGYTSNVPAADAELHALVMYSSVVAAVLALLADAQKPPYAKYKQ
jgi:hypothetical protein